MAERADNAGVIELAVLRPDERYMVQNLVAIDRMRMDSRTVTEARQHIARLQGVGAAPVGIDEYEGRMHRIVTAMRGGDGLVAAVRVLMDRMANVTDQFGEWPEVQGLAAALLEYDGRPLPSSSRSWVAAALKPEAGA